MSEDVLSLVEIETDAGSLWWRADGGPKPGTLLRVGSSGEVLEVVTAEQTESGWTLLVARVAADR